MTVKPKGTSLRHKFRIISGMWRGRVLSFAEQKDIRPTADRVRETLFNWLQTDLVGANCLDVFSGSAALSFEAISRGAAEVTSLEISQQACTFIQTNIQLLQTEKLKLLKTDALSWLNTQNPGKSFDIVFLDPPFTKDYLPLCCELLETNNWLSPDAFIYLESNSPLKNLTLPEHWRLMKHKKAGQVFFAYCKRESSR